MKNLKTGEIFGEYRVIEFLGAGGMGEVYRGEHIKLGRSAAIKIMSPLVDDTTFKERFFNEARLQASLHHPNIATLYDFQEINGKFCIFMEFVIGEPLNETITNRGFTILEALKIFSDVCDAVVFIHTHGIIHRDIKPANIKINSDYEIKLLDFGISKNESNPNLTQTEGIIGTPRYFAPELLNGVRANQLTDIWALGVLLYEMLTRTAPFEAKTFGSLYEQITKAKFVSPEKLNPAVSNNVSRLINLCLKRNPLERFQSVNELSENVKQIISSIEREKASLFELTTRKFTAEKIAPKLKNYVFGAIGIFLMVFLSFIGGSLLFKDSYTSSIKKDEIITNSNKNPRLVESVQMNNFKTRKVQIEVQGGEAEVLQNGKIICQKTPCIIEARKGERVKLTLRRENFEELPVQFDVTDWSKNIYTFSLKPK